MLSKKMEKAITDQIQEEFFSAYMYLSMSLECEGKLFKGMARWLKLQYEEEREHAQKMIDYMVDRGNVPELKDIKASKESFGTPLQLFEKVLAHEQHVTSLIHKLYELALAEKDYASQIFLQWFITEQVEEESSADEIVEKLKLMKNDSAALWTLDKTLGERKDD